jgi:hypothetical protein
MSCVLELKLDKKYIYLDWEDFPVFVKFLYNPNWHFLGNIGLSKTTAEGKIPVFNIGSGMRSYMEKGSKRLITHIVTPLDVGEAISKMPHKFKKQEGFYCLFDFYGKEHSILIPEVIQYARGFETTSKIFTDMLECTVI